MAQIRPLYIITNSNGAHTRTASATADELLVGKITLAGISGVALDAGADRLTNLGEPTAGTDAATKNYVDTTLSGLSVREPVRVTTTGGNVNLASTPASLDGVTLAVNDRVLVRHQSTPSQNGIYRVATGTTWVRADDCDATHPPKAGLYVFVNEGSSNADTAWVLTTDNPIILDTTALAFTQFSGLGQIDAGAGLAKSGNTLSIGRGQGLKVNADDIEVEIVASEALGFDASAPNGKLQVVLSGTTLSKSGGLSVLGLPTTFTIGGVAVSSNVTAANLTGLTGGGVTALHMHEASTITAIFEGGSSDIETVLALLALRVNEGPVFAARVAVTVAYYDWVYIVGVSGAYPTLAPATSSGTDAQAQVVGSVLGAETGGGGAVVNVRTAGVVPITGAYAGLGVAGTPMYLGTGGKPCLIADLASGAQIVQLGVAINTANMLVRIQHIGQMP